MKKLALLVLMIIGSFAVTGNVKAAELIFTADYTVDLSSPDVNMTILSGSEADSLTINDGNIQITVGNADDFSVSSSDRELNVTGQTTSIVNRSCVNGLSTVIVTGGSAGETITITPGANRCDGSAGRSGGQSGGSVPSNSPLVPGSAQTPPPSTTTTTTTTTTSGDGCRFGDSFSPTTGKPCPPTPEGCTATTQYSPVTGERCPAPPASSTSVSTTTTSTSSVTTIIPGRFIFTRDLFFGLQNDSDVLELQMRLTTEGCYTGAVTGNFDEATRDAVKCFQGKYKFNFVPATGYVGPYTRKVLNEGVSGFAFTRDLTVGSTGADVTALQQILIAKGFLKIPAPTGYFGAMTKAAVGAWQLTVGLNGQGYFGPLSRAKIAGQ